MKNKSGSLEELYSRVLLPVQLKLWACDNLQLRRRDTSHAIAIGLHSRRLGCLLFHVGFSSMAAGPVDSQVHRDAFTSVVSYFMHKG